MTRALRPGVVLGVVALAALSTLLGYAVGLQALTPIVGGLLFLMAGLVAANPGYAMVLLLSVGSSLSVGFMLGGEEAALSIADVSVDLQTAAFGFVVLTIVAVGARGFTSVPKRLHASKPAVCLGLFWVWCAFSLLWSPDLASGVRVLGQLLIICLTASGVGMLVSGHILQRFSVAKSLVVAGVLSLAWSGVALVQGRAFSTVPELPGVGRLAGSMGANTYGFFVLVTALAAWSMWGEPRRSWHIGARVWVGVSVILVILTVSRATRAAWYAQHGMEVAA